MSVLNPGQRCVIVAGCPENIGLIVEVVRRLGTYADYADAYLIRTVTGRPFHQLWSGKNLVKGNSTSAVTERYKLRPLVEPKEKPEDSEFEVPPPAVRQQARAVALDR